MEAALRQLAATVHLRRTNDAEAADVIRGMPRPVDDVAPMWLLDESRLKSSQVLKQRALLRAAARAKITPPPAPGGKDGKGKGNGNGKKGGQGGASSPETRP